MSDTNVSKSTLDEKTLQNSDQLQSQSRQNMDGLLEPDRLLPDRSPTIHTQNAAPYELNPFLSQSLVSSFEIGPQALSGGPGIRRTEGGLDQTGMVPHDEGAPSIQDECGSAVPTPKQSLPMGSIWSTGRGDPLDSGSLQHGKATKIHPIFEQLELIDAEEGIDAIDTRHGLDVPVNHSPHKPSTASPNQDEPVAPATIWSTGSGVSLPPPNPVHDDIWSTGAGQSLPALSVPTPAPLSKQSNIWSTGTGKALAPVLDDIWSTGTGKALPSLAKPTRGGPSIDLDGLFAQLDSCENQDPHGGSGSVGMSTHGASNQVSTSHGSRSDHMVDSIWSTGGGQALPSPPKQSDATMQRVFDLFKGIDDDDDDDPSTLHGTVQTTSKPQYSDTTATDKANRLSHTAKPNGTDVGLYGDDDGGDDDDDLFAFVKPQFRQHIQPTTGPQPPPRSGGSIPLHIPPKHNQGGMNSVRQQQKPLLTIKPSHHPNLLLHGGSVTKPNPQKKAERPMRYLHNPFQRTTFPTYHHEYTVHREVTQESSPVKNTPPLKHHDMESNSCLPHQASHAPCNDGGVGTKSFKAKASMFFHRYRSEGDAPQPPEDNQQGSNPCVKNHETSSIHPPFPFQLRHQYQQQYEQRLRRKVESMTSYQQDPLFLASIQNRMPSSPLDQPLSTSEAQTATDGPQTAPPSVAAIQQQMHPNTRILCDIFNLFPAYVANYYDLLNIPRQTAYKKHLRSRHHPNPPGSGKLSSHADNATPSGKPFEPFTIPSWLQHQYHQTNYQTSLLECWWLGDFLTITNQGHYIYHWYPSSAVVHDLLPQGYGITSSQSPFSSPPRDGSTHGASDQQSSSLAAIERCIMREFLLAEYALSQSNPTLPAPGDDAMAHSVLPNTQQLRWQTFQLPSPITPSIYPTAADQERAINLMFSTKAPRRPPPSHLYELSPLLFCTHYQSPCEVYYSLYTPITLDTSRTSLAPSPAPAPPPGGVDLDGNGHEKLRSSSSTGESEPSRTSEDHRVQPPSSLLARILTHNHPKSTPWGDQPSGSTPRDIQHLVYHSQQEMLGLLHPHLTRFPLHAPLPSPRMPSEGSATETDVSPPSLPMTSLDATPLTAILRPLLYVHASHLHSLFYDVLQAIQISIAANWYHYHYPLVISDTISQVKHELLRLQQLPLDHHLDRGVGVAQMDAAQMGVAQTGKAHGSVQPPAPHENGNHHMKNDNHITNHGGPNPPSSSLIPESTPHPVDTIDMQYIYLYKTCQQFSFGFLFHQLLQRYLREFFHVERSPLDTLLQKDGGTAYQKNLRILTVSPPTMFMTHDITPIHRGKPPALGDSFYYCDGLLGTCFSNPTLLKSETFLSEFHRCLYSDSTHESTCHLNLKSLHHHQQLLLLYCQLLQRLSPGAAVSIQDPTPAVEVQTLASVGLHGDDDQDDLLPRRTRTLGMNPFMEASECETQGTDGLKRRMDGASTVEHGDHHHQQHQHQHQQDNLQGNSLHVSSGMGRSLTDSLITLITHLYPSTSDSKHSSNSLNSSHHDAIPASRQNPLPHLSFLTLLKSVQSQMFDENRSSCTEHSGNPASLHAQHSHSESQPSSFCHTSTVYAIRQTLQAVQEMISQLTTMQTIAKSYLQLLNRCIGAYTASSYAHITDQYYRSVLQQQQQQQQSKRPHSEAFAPSFPSAPTSDGDPSQSSPICDDDYGAPATVDLPTFFHLQGSPTSPMEDFPSSSPPSSSPNRDDFPVLIHGGLVAPLLPYLYTVTDGHLITQLTCDVVLRKQWILHWLQVIKSFLYRCVVFETRLHHILSCLVVLPDQLAALLQSIVDVMSSPPADGHSASMDDTDVMYDRCVASATNQMNSAHRNIEQDTDDSCSLQITSQPSHPSQSRPSSPSPSPSPSIRSAQRQYLGYNSLINTSNLVEANYSRSADSSSNTAAVPASAEYSHHSVLQLANAPRFTTWTDGKVAREGFADGVIPYDNYSFSDLEMTPSGYIQCCLQSLADYEHTGFTRDRSHHEVPSLISHNHSKNETTEAIPILGTLSKLCSHAESLIHLSSMFQPSVSQRGTPITLFANIMSLETSCLMLQVYIASSITMYTDTINNIVQLARWSQQQQKQQHGQQPHNPHMSKPRGIMERLHTYVENSAQRIHDLRSRSWESALAVLATDHHLNDEFQQILYGSARYQWLLSALLHGTLHTFKSSSSSSSHSHDVAAQQHEQPQCCELCSRFSLNQPQNARYQPNYEIGLEFLFIALGNTTTLYQPLEILALTPRAAPPVVPRPFPSLSSLLRSTVTKIRPYYLGYPYSYTLLDGSLPKTHEPTVLSSLVLNTSPEQHGTDTHQHHQAPPLPALTSSTKSASIQIADYIYPIPLHQIHPHGGPVTKTAGVVIRAHHALTNHLNEILIRDTADSLTDMYEKERLAIVNKRMAKLNQLKQRQQRQLASNKNNSTGANNQMNDGGDGGGDDDIDIDEESLYDNLEKEDLISGDITECTILWVLGIIASSPPHHSTSHSASPSFPPTPHMVPYCSTSILYPVIIPTAIPMPKVGDVVNLYSIQPCVAQIPLATSLEVLKAQPSKIAREAVGWSTVHELAHKTFQLSRFSGYRDIWDMLGLVLPDVPPIDAPNHTNLIMFQQTYQCPLHGNNSLSSQIDGPAGGYPGGVPILSASESSHDDDWQIHPHHHRCDIGHHPCSPSAVTPQSSQQSLLGTYPPCHISLHTCLHSRRANNYTHQPFPQLAPRDATSPWSDCTRSLYGIEQSPSIYYLSPIVLRGAKHGFFYESKGNIYDLLSKAARLALHASHRQSALSLRTIPVRMSSRIMPMLPGHHTIYNDLERFSQSITPLSTMSQVSPGSLLTSIVGIVLQRIQFDAGNILIIIDGSLHLLYVLFPLDYNLRHKIHQFNGILPPVIYSSSGPNGSQPQPYASSTESAGMSTPMRMHGVHGAGSTPFSHPSTPSPFVTSGKNTPGTVSLSADPGSRSEGPPRRFIPRSIHRESTPFKTPLKTPLKRVAPSKLPETGTGSTPFRTPLPIPRSAMRHQDGVTPGSRFAPHSNPRTVGSRDAGTPGSIRHPGFGHASPICIRNIVYYATHESYHHFSYCLALTELFWLQKAPRDTCLPRHFFQQQPGVLEEPPGSHQEGMIGSTHGQPSTSLKSPPQRATETVSTHRLHSLRREQQQQSSIPTETDNLAEALFYILMKPTASFPISLDMQQIFEPMLHLDAFMRAHCHRMSVRQEGHHKSSSQDSQLHDLFAEADAPSQPENSTSMSTPDCFQHLVSSVSSHVQQTYLNICSYQQSTDLAFRLVWQYQLLWGYTQLSHPRLSSVMSPAIAQPNSLSLNHTPDQSQPLSLMPALSLAAITSSIYSHQLDALDTLYTAIRSPVSNHSSTNASSTDAPRMSLSRSVRASVCDMFSTTVHGVFTGDTAQQQGFIADTCGPSDHSPHDAPHSDSTQSQDDYQATRLLPLTTIVAGFDQRRSLWGKMQATLHSSVNPTIPPSLLSPCMMFSSHLLNVEFINVSEISNLWLPPSQTPSSHQFLPALAGSATSTPPVQNRHILVYHLSPETFPYLQSHRISYSLVTHHIELVVKRLNRLRTSWRSSECRESRNVNVITQGDRSGDKTASQLEQCALLPLCIATSSLSLLSILMFDPSVHCIAPEKQQASDPQCLSQTTYSMLSSTTVIFAMLMSSVEDSVSLDASTSKNATTFPLRNMNDDGSSTSHHDIFMHFHRYYQLFTAFHGASQCEEGAHSHPNSCMVSASRPKENKHHGRDDDQKEQLNGPSRAILPSEIQQAIHEPLTQPNSDTDLAGESSDANHHLSGSYSRLSLLDSPALLKRQLSRDIVENNEQNTDTCPGLMRESTKTNKYEANGTPTNDDLHRHTSSSVDSLAQIRSPEATRKRFKRCHSPDITSESLPSGTSSTIARDDDQLQSPFFSIRPTTRDQGCSIHPNDGDPIPPLPNTSEGMPPPRNHTVDDKDSSPRQRVHIHTINKYDMSDSYLDHSRQLVGTERPSGLAACMAALIGSHPDLVSAAIRLVWRLLFHMIPFHLSSPKGHAENMDNIHINRQGRLPLFHCDSTLSQMSNFSLVVPTTTWSFLSYILQSLLLVK